MGVLKNAFPAENRLIEQKSRIKRNQLIVSNGLGWHCGLHKNDGSCFVIFNEITQLLAIQAWCKSNNVKGVSNLKKADLIAKAQEVRIISSSVHIVHSAFINKSYTTSFFCICSESRF